MKRMFGPFGPTGRARPGIGRFAVSMLAAAPVIAGAWLILAAIPVLADGGPHVSSINSGASSLTADSCAGCHRAHTGQGEYLLTQSEETLCLSCHGGAGTGATTDVENGVQYVPSGTGSRTTNQLGALRDGGFLQAAISSGNPSRVLTTNQLGSSEDQLAKVQVRVAAGSVAPAPVTSAHLDLTENLTSPTIAWGNGAIGPLGDTGPGPVVTMSCGTCHNPHGNGQYRILNTIPEPAGTGFDPIPVAPDFANSTVPVADSLIDPDGNPANGIENPTKNYTVIQVKGTGTPPTPSSMLLYADDVTTAGYGPTTGDYWHVRVPWNSATGANDAPNGRPAIAPGVQPFNHEITNWCTACHTRYMSGSGDSASGDALFAYRHETNNLFNKESKLACTTCHVAHGSNAVMDGQFSSTFPYPGMGRVNVTSISATGLVTTASAHNFAVGVRVTISGATNGNGTYTVVTAPSSTTFTVAYSGTAGAGGTVISSSNSSRLLKVDNRGTCQMCHDPTYTFATGTPVGPTPTPGVP